MINHIRFDIELAAEMKINKRKVRMTERKKEKATIECTAAGDSFRFDLIIIELDIEGTFKASA